MDSLVISFGLFTLIKLIGYSLAGRRLNKVYKVVTPNAFAFGLVRTIIGIGAGLTVLYLTVSNRDDVSLHLAVLVPVRFIEWFIMIYLFYERDNFSLRRISGFSALGVLYSFALDIPAIFAGFIWPGEFSFC